MQIADHSAGNWRVWPPTGLGKEHSYEYGTADMLYFALALYHARGLEQ